MSLDGGNKVPEMKLTPVTQETTRVLNSIFQQLCGSSGAPDGSWKFNEAKFGVCREGFQVKDVKVYKYAPYEYINPNVNDIALLALVAVKGCKYVKPDNSIYASILIPWSLFTEAYITLPLQDLMALVGNQIALDIVSGKSVVVGEDQGNAGVEPSAGGVSSGEYRVSFIVDATCRESEVAAGPARDEVALFAAQVRRQVDAALARKGNEGPVETDAG